MWLNNAERIICIIGILCDKTILMRLKSKFYMSAVKSTVLYDWVDRI